MEKFDKIIENKRDTSTKYRLLFDSINTPFLMSRKVPIRIIGTM
jgi:hypothetical protein